MGMDSTSVWDEMTVKRLHGVGYEWIRFLGGVFNIFYSPIVLFNNVLFSIGNFLITFDICRLRLACGGCG